MQVECHAFFNQSKLLEFCKERDVAVAAFSPLGSPARPWAAAAAAAAAAEGEEAAAAENLLDDPKLKEIADQHGKSVAQVRTFSYTYILHSGGRQKVTHAKFTQLFCV